MNSCNRFFWRPALSALTLLFLCSCSPGSSVSVYKSSRIIMGTLVEVSVRATEQDARTATNAVFDELKRVEDLTSFHKASGLTTLNDAAGGEPVRVNEELFRLVQKSIAFAEKTDGAFDPTVGPLTRLWQFSAGEPRLPEEHEIAEALSTVGWRQVEVDTAAGTVRLPRKGMALDLAAMSKRYALDRAAEVFKRLEITSGLVNAGGDICVVGEKEPGRPWRVGVQDPREQGGVIAVAELKDCFVITSGDYERSFIRDGKRYHHILDPKTGYPTKGMQSATVVLRDASNSDALSTAVFVMGPEVGLNYLKSLPGVEALLIDASGAFHMTPGARDVFQLKKDRSSAP